MRRDFLMRLLILIVLAGGQIWEVFEELTGRESSVDTFSMGDCQTSQKCFDNTRRMQFVLNAKQNVCHYTHFTSTALLNLLC